MFSDDSLAKMDDHIEKALESSGYKVEKDPYYNGGRSEAEWIDYLSHPVEKVYINADIKSQHPSDLGYTSIVVSNV